MSKAERTRLAQALDHVCLAAGGPAAYAPFCRFDPYGGLTGFDGLISAGFTVNEHESAAPNAEIMRQAVNRAGDPYSLTFNYHKGECTVRGEKIRAAVPMLPLDQMPNVLPGPALRPIDATLRPILRDAGKAASRRHSSIVGSAVLMRKNSAVATDGVTVIEGWHGCNLPGDMLVPVEFTEALGKVKLPLSHCGYDAESFTIWFGPEAWLKCRAYAETFPDTDLMFAKLNAASNDWRPVPPDLMRACDMLKPFRQSATLTLTATGINTMPDGSGAAYNLEHYLPHGLQFPYDALRLMAEFGQWVKFSRAGAYWQGEHFRGATSLS